MSKSETIKIVLTGRYKGNLPGTELELPAVEANVILGSKIGRLAKKARKPKATEEDLEA